jgi:hypothetical protein
MAAGKLTVTCTLFWPWPKNTLRGFASIRIGEIGLVIHDVAVHQQRGARWAQLPAKAHLHDGALVKDADGKIQYVKIMGHAQRPVSAAVIEHAPDAFGGAP